MNRRIVHHSGTNPIGKQRIQARMHEIGQDIVSDLFRLRTGNTVVDVTLDYARRHRTGVAWNDQPGNRAAPH